MIVAKVKVSPLRNRTKMNLFSNKTAKKKIIDSNK